LIPDIEKFLSVAIFKMAATIPHKFIIVRFQRQNGRHNTAQKGCSYEKMASKMGQQQQWETVLHYYRFHKVVKDKVKKDLPNKRHHYRPVEILQCRESIWDIIIYPHIKC
jgi:hypothetical protein